MRRLWPLPWHPKPQATEQPRKPATAAAISRAGAQVRQTFIIFRCENLRLRSTFAVDPALRSGVTIRTPLPKAERNRSDKRYHFNSEAVIEYELRFEG